MEEFDSSTELFISDLKESPSAVLSIYLSNSSLLYTRFSYLNCELECNQILNKKLLDELYSASRCFLAECKALAILNYAENSRLMLERKLSKKDFSKTEIERALNYLEDLELLSDKRFAESWLRSRLKLKPESKQYLHSALISRGVSYQIAKKALDEAFETFDEAVLCRQALEKQVKKTDDAQKIFSRLISRGFPYASIKKAFFDFQTNKLNS